jgi:hypothetical protein
MFIAPGPQETQAGGSLEPRDIKSAWATQRDAISK